MNTRPAIIDDIGHVLDILKKDNSAAWKAGAASMLESIAANIREDVEEKKQEEVKP